MELFKDELYQGISFEIFKEGLTEYGSYLSLPMQVYNHSKSKKKVEAFIYYISVNKGVLDVYTDPFRLSCGGCELHTNSFIDTILTCEELKEVTEGDRLEFRLEINDKKYPPFIVVRQLGDWYVFEDEAKNSKLKDNDTKSISAELKKKIENFEYIEEQFGIVLQKFSVRVIDENSIQLFCEVLALNGEIQKEGFNIEVAIYDTDDNIVFQTSISRGDGYFKGFEVFNFGTIRLDIPVEEISKIRIYPTR